MSKLTTILKLNKVSLIKKKQDILKDLNWEVRSGEHWVVLGSNGSGKTMMLKIISGYIWPSKGEIFVLGKKFGDVDLSALRQTIGWVSFDLQQKMQQEFSALEVVLSGFYASIGLYKKPTADVLKRAIYLLKFIGCNHIKDNLFPALSYGEQKKVLIARSLISKPKLLLLDEPCSGLDLKMRESFLAFINKLASKRNGPTIIFVTHHLEEIVPAITNILALKKGRIIKKGKKEDLMDSGLVKKVLGVNVEVIKNGQRYMTHMI